MSLHVDGLVLEAKTAILEEQYAKFRKLAHDGKGEEALEQTHRVLASIADVLRDANRLWTAISAGSGRSSSGQ
jgi:hypothetical protein